MSDFNFKCPVNYPLKCTLQESDKKNLERSEKYRIFLMYQFKEQESFLRDAINEYFASPTYYVYDAKEESGLCVKICKICRLALASDFGVVSLTPRNHNVFFEIGLMQGLGKPVVLTASRNIMDREGWGLKDIPFDKSDQIIIEYKTKKELLDRLAKELPIFVEKVQINREFEAAFRKNLEEKIQKLTTSQKQVLKILVLHKGRVEEKQMQKGFFQRYGLDKYLEGDVYELYLAGFLIKNAYPYYNYADSTGYDIYFEVSNSYQQLLEEILFL